MIERILFEADQIDWSKDDEICRFYESQYLFFNNYKSLTEVEDIIEIIYIKTRYIESLINKSHFKKALKITEEIDFLLTIVDGNWDEYDTLRVDNLFHKGLLNSRLNKDKISLPIFQELVKVDKENDRYQSWLSYCKLQVRYKYFNYVSYVGLAIVFGRIMGELAFNIKVNNSIALIGYILLLAGWLIPLALKNIEKRKTA